eukprot:6477004-Amphidinium_carterae.1
MHDAFVSECGKFQKSSAANAHNLKNDRPVEPCAVTLVTQHPHLARDDALVINTDLDEIPSREAMWALRNCDRTPSGNKKFDIVQLHLNLVKFSMRSLTHASLETWKQGTVRPVAWLKQQNFNAKGETVSLRQGNRVLSNAGVHLHSTTNLAAFLYKGVQHGEGGNCKYPVLKTQGKQVGFCEIDSLEAVRGAQNALQDNPKHWDRPEQVGWLLPHNVPKDSALEAAGVPWVIRSNPSRYAFFFGSGSLSETHVQQRANTS